MDIASVTGLEMSEVIYCTVLPEAENYTRNCHVSQEKIVHICLSL